MTSLPMNTGYEPITMRIIYAVADVHDVEPTSLDPPLGSVLDLDALDALLRTDGDESVSVQFQYADCDVRVEADDVVVECVDDGG